MNAADEAIEKASSSCERWEWGFAVVVVLSVAAEFVLASVHPSYDSPWNRWGSAIADALIALGIVGEVLFGRMDGRYQTELRKRSNSKLAEANEHAAEANRIAEEERHARVKLERQLAARTLTKEQFDILKKLKGKVPALIIASDAETEPVWFATIVASALQNIGIEVGVAIRAPHAHSTANFICDKRAFSNPDGEPTNGEPAVSIFNEAGIPIDGVLACRPEDLSDETGDIPMIVIGGRYVIPPASPYLGENIPSPHPTMIERMRTP